MQSRVRNDKQFKDAVDFVRALPPNDGRMDTATQMNVYGLYKVATAGAPPASCPKFGMFENLKFDAWKDAAMSCNNDTDIAKTEYVLLIQQLQARFAQQ